MKNKNIIDLYQIKHDPLMLKQFKAEIGTILFDLGNCQYTSIDAKYKGVKAKIKLSFGFGKYDLIIDNKYLFRSSNGIKDASRFSDYIFVYLEKKVRLKKLGKLEFEES